jgi:S1-C subfamily serine protease
VLQSHVCVVLDFPDTNRGMDVVADQGQNHLIAEEFGVRSLPTLALADDQGRAFFLKRDWSDGFGGMPTKIAEWSKLKAERDALLAAAGQVGDTEQLEAAAKFVKWLQDQSVVRSHAAQIGDWLSKAERSDADNQQGLLEVFFEPQWLLDLSRISGDDVSGATAVLGKIDPWAARKFQNPDRGAKLHMTAAIVLARMEQFEKATKQLELASRYKPIDPELVSAVDELKRQLAMRELLGTGTGFLISSDGYVLTNHHVIEGDGQVEVRLPGQTETLAAKIVASDAGRDIALLKVTLPADSTCRPLSVTIGKLGDGSPIATFGHPYGDALGTGIKTTVGAVSAMPPAHKDNMYLLDLRVNSGNSGGPLCDAYGNVVGMISAKVLIGEIGDSYALAIPAEDLLKFLEKQLPADTPLASAAPADNSLDWPTVRTQVESGVLMVLNKKK